MEAWCLDAYLLCRYRRKGFDYGRRQLIECVHIANGNEELREEDEEEEEEELVILEDDDVDVVVIDGRRGKWVWGWVSKWLDGGGRMLV